MNPDEAWIGRALVVGIFFVIAMAAQALWEAESDGAFRLKVALGGIFILGAAAVWFMMVGLVGFIITLGLLAVGVWVYKGFKK
jgi:hypothetical protein